MINLKLYQGPHWTNITVLTNIKLSQGPHWASLASPNLWLDAAAQVILAF